MDENETTVAFHVKQPTIYRTLYDLLDSWQESYCSNADDGGHVEDSIVKHARCMLAMPDASLEEMLNWLLHNS